MLLLDEVSKAELLPEFGPTYFLQNTSNAYRVLEETENGEELLFTVGVVPIRIISKVGLVWLKPTKALHAKHIRWLRKMFEAESKNWRVLLAYWESPDPIGERFAKAFGFEKFNSHYYFKRIT